MTNLDSIVMNQAYGYRSLERRIYGPSTIENETVFGPRGLNRELDSLVHQKAGMILL